MRPSLRGAARRVVPAPVRQRLHRLRRPAVLGTVRRTRPLSEHWGRDRGDPVDRHYIEAFLERHQADIRGRGLEVKDSGYLRRFGTGITRTDVLDLDASNPAATIVADLASADAITEGSFDCFLLTQTLQLIYDVRAACEHAHRILAPGGVLLVTVPGITRVARGYPDYWRFTPAACQALFAEVFGEDAVEVTSYGNVLSAMAFLTGMAKQELSARELDDTDPAFPVIVGIRARKRA
jgi:SAM-dependent methyltransferase